MRDRNGTLLYRGDLVRLVARLPTATRVVEGVVNLGTSSGRSPLLITVTNHDGPALKRGMRIIAYPNEVEKI